MGNMLRWEKDAAEQNVPHWQEYTIVEIRDSCRAQVYRVEGMQALERPFVDYETAFNWLVRYIKEQE